MKQNSPTEKQSMPTYDNLKNLQTPFLAMMDVIRHLPDSWANY